MSRLSLSDVQSTPDKPKTIQPPSRSWDSLPRDIRVIILDYLIYEPGSLITYARVSQEWQHYIESCKFSNLLIQDTDLDKLKTSLLPRQRQHIKYLWFNVNLSTYIQWGYRYRVKSDVMDFNGRLFGSSIGKLFHILKTCPEKSITLEISMHPPSDAHPYFEHWYFGSEAPFEDPICLPPGFRYRQKDIEHEEARGYPLHMLQAMYRCLQMCNLPELPKVLAVKEFVWLRQSRTRLPTHALGQMLQSMVNLETVRFESWRTIKPEYQSYWDFGTQAPSMKLIVKRLTGQTGTERYFIDCFPTTLKRLSFFESCNELISKNRRHRGRGRPNPRFPNMNIAIAAAYLARQLEHFSMSFTIDALQFFALVASGHYTFPHLKTLCLTAMPLLLTPHHDFQELLRRAAQTVKMIPQLQTMTLWYTIYNVTAKFTYSRTDVCISWLSNLDVNLSDEVLTAWRETVEEIWYPNVTLRVQGFKMENSPGCLTDGIGWLSLSEDVIHPVSLWQMQREAPMESRSAVLY